YHRTAAARLDLRLLQLPIARLDGKPLPVRLPHPLTRRWHEPPVGVHQRLTTVPLPLPPVVATLDADTHGCCSPAPLRHGVAVPAARLPGAEDLRSAGAFGMVGLPSPENDRHQEGVAGGLEIADHSDAEKAPV